MNVFWISFICFGLGISAASAGPLHDAAREGNVERVKQLADQGANLSEPDDTGEPKGGLTALHAAAYGGHLDIVERLVARGASVNDHENFYHMTPLHAAAEEGHADVIAFLLAQKADVEPKERNGYTPVTQAGWRSHWDSVTLLLKAGAACQGADLTGQWLYDECTKRK
jgi:ankyrin repeat protein